MLLLVEEKRKLEAETRDRGIKLFICLALNQTEKGFKVPTLGAIKKNYAQ